MTKPQKVGSQRLPCVLVKQVVSTVIAIKATIAPACLPQVEN